MKPKEALAILKAAYPRGDFPLESERLYDLALRDIPAAVLAAATHRLVRSGGEFFPSIAQIRRTAASLCGLLPPTPAEVLVVLRRADTTIPMRRSDGSVAYEERVWDWPDDADPLAVACAQEALAKAGEPRDGEGAMRFGWETAFQQVCGEVVERHAAAAMDDLSTAALAPGGKRHAIGAWVRPWAREEQGARGLPAGAPREIPEHIRDVMRRFLPARASPEGPSAPVGEKTGTTGATDPGGSILGRPGDAQ